MERDEHTRAPKFHSTSQFFKCENKSSCFYRHLKWFNYCSKAYAWFSNWFIRTRNCLSLSLCLHLYISLFQCVCMWEPTSDIMSRCCRHTLKSTHSNQNVCVCVCVQQRCAIKLYFNGNGNVDSANVSLRNECAVWVKVCLTFDWVMCVDLNVRYPKFMSAIEQECI